ncbi:hypothetical protein HKCCE3408_17240 [Rhodobacterales bacterium HKCCE3408]|nr:hypothetical protein [Rhodobacterales bacterium HKCCE3408]
MNATRGLVLAFCLSACPAAAQDPAAVYDLLCGRTAQFYSPGIGTQIEYTAPDGRAFLWFPGQDDVILGTWEVGQMTDGVAELCYVYEPGSFTGEDGETFCFTYPGLIADLVEGGLRDGDPYDLMSGEVPFVTLPFSEVDPTGLKTEYPDQPQAPACAGLFS